MKPASEFVELDKTVHNRQSFDSGTQTLNHFLQQFAVRHRAVGISKTMVLPAASNNRDICAYYTLSHTEIERTTLPKKIAKKLPYYPIPVMSIAQLAVNRSMQGQGLGKITLIQALKHCYSINRHLPSNAVVVDALDEKVQRFYEKYGFQRLGSNNGRIRLFIAMGTIEQLFND